MSDTDKQGARREFNAEANCPKCWGDDIGTAYKADSHGHGCTGHKAREPECCTDEHFHRSCKRCHYAWREEIMGERERAAAVRGEQEEAQSDG